MSSKQNELSLEQRVLKLEQEVKFYKEATGQMDKTIKVIISNMNKLIEKDKRDKQELSRWASQVEERLGKLIVQQANLGLAFDTAVELTEEQKTEIEKKVKHIKKQHKIEESKKEED